LKEHLYIQYNNTTQPNSKTKINNMIVMNYGFIDILAHPLDPNENKNIVEQY
jgi:hypothetical protein